MSQQQTFFENGNIPTVLLETLSDDVGTKTSPVGYNIQLQGHVNNQSGKFSTVLHSASGIMNVNPMSVTRWIVDSLGFNGTHQTIQSAITSASSGDTIAVMDGTYVEDPVLKAGVDLVAYTADAFEPNVIIQGNLQASFAGVVSMSGIQIETNSNYCLSVTGSNNTVVNMYDCYINCLNHDGINFTSSSSSSGININLSHTEINNSAYKLFNHSAAGGLAFRWSGVGNSAASSVASVCSGSGVLSFQDCNVNIPIVTSGSSSFGMWNCIEDTVLAGAISLTLGGTGANVVYNNTINSGTQTGIYVGSGATVGADLNVINSSATNAIDGPGTFNYSLISMIGSSSKINATNQNSGTALIGAVQTTLPASYPYTTLATDNVILVDTSSAANTINLMTGPKAGQSYRIKDRNGNATTNNITITPATGNIDGASNYVISLNYGSVDLVYNGTQWNIL